MWVCLCNNVTDHEIRDLLESPLINDVDDVGAACGAGTGCGSCRDEIRQLCEQARVEQAERGVPVAAPVRVVGHLGVQITADIHEKVGAEVDSAA